MPETPEILRPAVRAAMRRLGWTQAELARRAGVHRVYVCRWLGGRRHIAQPHLERVLTALGLSVGVPVPKTEVRGDAGARAGP